MNLVSAIPIEADTQRYRLLAPIARGGMAELHLAATQGAGECTKVVAVKRVWPELADEPEFVSMFNDEARLAVRFNHPNVVQTFEVGSMAGRLFMAMEFLEGQTLNAVLSRLHATEVFSMPLRLKVLCHVLAGLHYAHELTAYDGTPLQVVHRDVSPQNVFITYDGSVKLLDFGIAKTLAAAHQTLPGVLKGRLAYMAPECVRGEDVDRRADIFSVGIMLWEMAANRRFWRREPETTILRTLVAGLPIEVPALPSHAPPGLDAICRRALSLDRADRYATASEMQVELERVLADHTDSFDRKLGAVVAYAFQEERQKMRTLIDLRLKGEPLPPEFEPGTRGSTRSYPALALPTPPPDLIPMALLSDLSPPKWWANPRTWGVIAALALGGVVTWVAMTAVTLAGHDTASNPSSRMPSQLQGNRSPQLLQAPAAAGPTAAPRNTAAVAPQAAPPKRIVSRRGKPDRAAAAKVTSRAERPRPTRSDEPSHRDSAQEAPSPNDSFDLLLPRRTLSPPSSTIDVNNPYR